MRLGTEGGGDRPRPFRIISKEGGVGLTWTYGIHLRHWCYTTVLRLRAICP